MYPLAPDALLLLKLSALDGSGDAAYELFERNNAHGRSEALQEEAFYWAQVGAENGHSGAQHALGMMLHERSITLGDKKMFRRSCYWLRKASQHDVDAEKEWHAIGCAHIPQERP